MTVSNVPVAQLQAVPPPPPRPPPWPGHSRVFIFGALYRESEAPALRRRPLRGNQIKIQVMGDIKRYIFGPLPLRRVEEGIKT